MKIDLDNLSLITPLPSIERFSIEVRIGTELELISTAMSDIITYNLVPKLRVIHVTHLDASDSKPLDPLISLCEERRIILKL